MEELNYKIGDTVKFVSRNSYGPLHPGDLVEVVDIQPGMFPPDIYVSTLTKSGHTITGFSWRFQEIPNED